jgi:type IV secretion system protein VirB9
MKMRMRQIGMAVLLACLLAGCATDAAEREQPVRQPSDGELGDLSAAWKPGKSVETGSEQVEQETRKVVGPEVTPTGQQRVERPEPRSPRNKARPVSETIDEANAQARRNPDEYSYFHAITTYNYTEGALYQVYCAPRKVTNLQLAPGEKATSVAAGDTIRWQIQQVTSGQGGQQRTNILIKPTRPDLKTNLVIYTNMRVYTVELTSYAETYMAGVRWRYANPSVMQMSPEERTKHRNAEAHIASMQPEDLNFDYGFVAKEVPEWMPIRVFDDGAHVYIEFPEGMRQKRSPVLFVRSPESGGAEMVNYRVKGNYYIVDRLFEMAELRVGEDHPIVVGIEKCHGGCQ